MVTNKELIAAGLLSPRSREDAGFAALAALPGGPASAASAIVEQAKDLGLVNYAVPADELDAKVAGLVAKLLANPRWAVRWTKTVANIPLRALAAQTMDAAVGWESVSNSHADRREAVAAMREKRAPRFTGE